MALTVARTMALPGMRMRLLAGRSGTWRAVRWAHVSELADPVPWLSGGELVMTIGLGLPAEPDGRRAYVERLAAAGCAALAFALHEAMEEVPDDLLDAADACGLPVLEVLTSFISVTEAVARWHADERVRGERRVVAAQEAMARAALAHGTAGILRTLAEHAAGEALLLGPHGEHKHAVPARERPWHARAAEAAAASGGGRSAGVLDDGIEAVQVHSLGFSGAATGWLAVRTASPLDWHVRMLTSHAACLLAIELLGLRVGRSRMHAQRGALLAAVLDGRLPAARLGELCSVAAAPYEVVVARPGVSLEAAVEALEEVTETGDEETALVCVRPEGTVFVLPENTGLPGDQAGGRPGGQAGGRPGEPAGGRLGEQVRGRLGVRLCARLGVAGGGCRAAGLEELPAAVRHAAALVARGGGDGYAHVDDMEPQALLRDAFVPEAARRFSTAVLRPLREHEARHGGDLVGTLRAYLEAGDNAETAARRLGVHRNTLRRRLAAAERVSGGPLTDPGHRLRLWLALSLPDLVPPGSSRAANGDPVRLDRRARDADAEGRHP
ncbi:PucR family transcriptional regulator [Nonomuraea wenchangensis]|uniref:PucR family transcriptional regulator n=1 Tax=Nonomuraea wenchangensis TaxID=568860 RepID=UPI003716C18B